MNPIIKGKLRLLGEFCFFGAIAGIIFQLLHEGIVDYRAFLLGISLGSAYGIIELFILTGLRKKFLKLPLLLTIIIKALVYLIIINLISGILILITGRIQGKEIEEFYQIMFGKMQLILNIYTLILFVLFSFYIQINLLLGEGVLFKFLMGKYRKPIAEHRIFMFLDIKSSTSIAE